MQENGLSLYSVLKDAPIVILRPEFTLRLQFVGRHNIQSPVCKEGILTVCGAARSTRDHITSQYVIPRLFHAFILRP